MAHFFDDNADLRWYIDTGIDWEPIVRLTEHDFRSPDGFTSTAEAVEFYREVLDLVGGFVGEEIAPKWRELDHAHPHVEDGEVVYPPVFDDIFEQIKDLGLHGLCIPRELGGMNAPLLLLQINNELFARADVSVCAHYGFHGGMALSALTYSILEGSTEFQTDPPMITSTRFQEAIDEIIAGETFGSMDITEPDAGSDMARLRTRGVQDEEGNWFVTGQKIYITSGHGRWHFVIARTEEPKGDDAFAGLQGLSMFLVPAWDLDENGNKVRTTTIDGVETKLGHNGSATVAISFENSPAHLIGKRGEGFKFMLLLMNGARVGVGFESLGLCVAAYEMAREYAAQRVSMGKTIDQHEMIADYLEEMATDIQAIRAVAVKACWHEELNQKLNMRLIFDPPSDPEERKKLEREKKMHQRKARRLTPLLKYSASEKAVRMARLNIQIHGGAGYTTDYPAEKLLRDAMVFPIYEGTSQIQGLMAMKDTLMGAVKSPARFLRAKAKARFRSLSARDPLERRVQTLVLQQHQTVQFLLSRLIASKVGELRKVSPLEWTSALSDVDPKRDFALAMLHAEHLILMLSDVATAEVLWEQASEHPERRELLERFLDRAEPNVRHQIDLIQNTGARLLKRLRGAEDTPAARAAK